MKKIEKTFLTIEYDNGDKEEFFSEEHAGNPIENTIDYLKALQENDNS